MMKKLILITIAVLVFSAVYAQSTPDWLWARNAGCDGLNGLIEASSICTDNSGNIYVSGYFEGIMNLGSLTLSNNGDTDIFIAKLSPEGIWLWAQSCGSNTYDIYSGISVDGNGNCYVTGNYYDTAVLGPFTLTSNGDSDCFIAKLDTNGNWLWARSAGGTGADQGLSVIAHDLGGCVVTGWFSGSAAFDSYSLTSSGDWDIFVTKLDTNGNFLWASKAGGMQDDGGMGISSDAVGNVYVTGVFRVSAAFGSQNLISSGDNDIFVAKLNPSGTWLWAKKAGGYGGDWGSDIATDTLGNSYIVGSFVGNADFGNIHINSSGSSDAFIAKLDSSGNWLWVRKGGGTGNDYADGVALNPSGRSVSFSGSFYKSALLGGSNLISNGDNDIFAAKLDVSGNWLWAKRAGGDYSAYNTVIATDTAGNNFVAGCFDINVEFGSIVLNSTGYTDIFVAKLAEPVPQMPSGLNISKSGNNIRLDWSVVSGARSYKVFGSSEPYPTEAWSLLSHTALNTYIYTGSEDMHFFRVVADTEP